MFIAWVSACMIPMLLIYIPMKYIFTSFCLFSLLQVKAQLHDNMWMFHNGVSIFHIDFREHQPVISRKDPYLMINGTGSSIFCDEEGDLLYYSNGIRINNKIDSLLENGDSLNTGSYYFNNNQYPVQYGCFFLPAPGDSTHCYFIYMYPEKYPGMISFPLPIKVHYALIDRTANNGLGKVVEKNISLMPTGGLDFNFNHAGAVRHANGRDWWVLVPNRMEPEFYRILLTPQGFSVPEEQTIGFKAPTDNPYRYLAHTLFSPDGTKYAELNYINHPGGFPEVTGFLQFYDFDRCTGLLSNPIVVNVPPSNQLGPAIYISMAFSPSGQRFYLNYQDLSGSNLVQYDMQSTDIEGSAQTLFNCPAVSPKWTCQTGFPLLAPDGRVYVGGLVDTIAWHVIHHPDKIGAACHFELGGGFVFPEKYAQGWTPYLPNYRLGPIDGSACDTLGIDNHPLAGFYWEITDTLTPLEVEFTDHSFYEPTEWFWDFGDGMSSTDENPVHEYAASGSYLVCQTVSNQYDSDTICKLVTVTGLTPLKETNAGSRFKVFPNPASRIVHLNYDLAPGTSAKWRLFNSIGKEERQVSLAPGSGSHTVSLDGLAAGLYFYKVEATGELLNSGILILSR
jgi:hypothetical protein